MTVVFVDFWPHYLRPSAGRKDGVFHFALYKFAWMT